MNKLVLDALKDIGAPVAFQEYTGPAVPVYVTFFFYNEMGTEFVEDEEAATSYSLQVDVWSNGNYKSVVKSVKDSLKSVGFMRVFATDLYEKDTKIYHKVLRFRCTEIV
ncbi:tail completion protein gp17 [Bacillus sp. Hm123]|uniref:tail completion protein gp17 n=1 Tax=Bacillus sp. Hm123 TaxID=3450745 RepID=UPI003F42C715